MQPASTTPTAVYRSRLYRLKNNKNTLVTIQKVSRTTKTGLLPITNSI